MTEAAAAASAPATDGQDDPKRDRSTIEFPYLDLDDSTEIAKAVHTVGGSSCQVDQLAAHLQVKPGGGGFRLRLQTAKMFGLITYERGQVNLTSLGTRLCDSQQEKAAKSEAFLTIPLYKAVYDKFKGVSLPPTSGLEGVIGTLGVAPKVKDKARQALMRSANQAGYFAFGADRLVMPAIKGSAVEVDPAKDQKDKTNLPEDPGAEKPPKKKKSHALIEGLIEELPEPKTEWTTEDRKKWLEMASTVFNVIYKDSDDSRGSLKISVEKSSTK